MRIVARASRLKGICWGHFTSFRPSPTGPYSRGVYTVGGSTLLVPIKSYYVRAFTQGAIPGVYRDYAPKLSFLDYELTSFRDLMPKF